MFNVYKKETDEIVDVYDVRTDRAGYPMFLIFENNQWKYRSAKYFKPYICWVRAEEDI
nr:MAG TPA: hypothetical protein [Caudoviricetes sp.]